GAPQPADSLLYGDIIVSEIMANPNACDDTDCEYIELYNTTGLSFDLQGLVLVDAGANSSTLTAPLPIGPHGYVVLGRTTWAYLDFTPDASFTFGVNNTNESIELRNANGTLAVTPLLNAPTPAGTSMQLGSGYLDVFSMGSASSWCPSTAPIGSSGDVGTPGAPNGPCP
ncbi:MAG: lamin tail domain-containing protein, partial [Myxococcales bacterium]|nr:lamin tail domain-containing protein [Myxococcales bacterium]